MSKFDKQHIENKTDDWVKRVEDIYSLVKTALADSQGIECRSAGHMTMNDELMQKSGVLPKKVPILDLYKDKSLIASFKPVGLWVVGAKGRIDILTKSGSFILVDVADKDSEPDWKVFSPGSRKKGVVFNSEFVGDLVREQ